MSLKSDLAGVIAERRRLAILQILSEVPPYTLDEVTIQEVLLVAKKISVTASDLRDDFRLLRNHDCVHTDTDAGVWVVSLTREGGETGKGLRPVEGVALPLPS